jgi:O-antigen ligase
VFVHPLADESLQLRLTTWKAAVEEIRHHPIGTGLGSAGRASERNGDGHVVIDNSYLLVLREQGWLGGPVFIVGVVLLLVAVARSSLVRLRPFNPL